MKIYYFVEEMSEKDISSESCFRLVHSTHVIFYSLMITFDSEFDETFENKQLKSSNDIRS